MGILETLKPATHTPVYSKEDGALGPACGDIPAGPVILRTKGLIYDLMEGFLSRMNTDPWAYISSTVSRSGLASLPQRARWVCMGHEGAGQGHAGLVGLLR